MEKTSVSKKILSGLAAVLVLFFLAFSAFYISEHHSHHCSEENCRVCVCIDRCKTVLTQLSQGVQTVGAAFAILTYAVSCIVIFACNVIKGTPITQKVRLND